MHGNNVSLDVEYCEEENKSIVPNNNETPVSPSTSPYIPISECFTGKTPVLTQQVSYFVLFN